MENRRECLVCSTKIDSMHLGMDICRACASFFKRAKMTGVVYPCRQGTRQCAVSKESKFTCRRCRFDKCLSVGVAYDGPLRIRTTTVISLLDRIEKEFKSMIERRRVRELEFMKTCPNSYTMPHPTQKIFIVTASSSFEIFTIALKESWVFFENSFIGLASLDQLQKERIFKGYIVKLGTVVSYYLTMKLFGEVGRKRVMSSVITCYDNDVPVDFYYPEEHGNKSTFESSIHTYNDEHATLFLPQFTHSQLTEKEFFALSALVLTEHDSPISEEAEVGMYSIRHAIFNDLHSYYKNELGLVDYSTRLGNLMSVNHAIQECSALHKVVLQYYYTFFDVYVTEQIMEMLSI